MKKFIKIYMASTKGNLNIFKMNIKNSILNVIIIILLTISIFFSVGSYAYMFGEPLHEANLTYVMLAIFMLVSVLIVFMEGIYKSQGILFDSKDNDMLFSMPIKKSTILNVRICYLLFFQYIFELMFMLPALAVYVFFETPSIPFYLISFLILILLPIIPTLIACIFGYFIQALSPIFKKKKVVQTLFSLVLTLGILYFSFSTSNESFFRNIVGSAGNIIDVISKTYYPVGLCIKLITNFNFADLILFVLISIVPILLYIYLFSIKYFKIISKSTENYSSSQKIDINKSVKSTKPLIALLKKELARYFSSPIYIINTIFGAVLVFIFAINCAVNFKGSINSLIQSGAITFDLSLITSYFPYIYMMMLLIIIPTITITASSISLEGSSIEITKSLPVKTKTIFLSKILTQDIVATSILLISTLILIFTRSFTLVDSIICILICIILPNLYGILGLIINLKFPLLNAKSDTVVVKQSISTLVALLSGFILGAAPIIIFFKSNISNISNYALIVLLIYTLLVSLLWKVLNTYGNKQFMKL